MHPAYSTCTLYQIILSVCNYDLEKAHRKTYNMRLDTKQPTIGVDLQKIIALALSPTAPPTTAGTTLITLRAQNAFPNRAHT
jgi:hypothetical protein